MPHRQTFSHTRFVVSILPVLSSFALIGCNTTTDSGLPLDTLGILPVTSVDQQSVGEEEVGSTFASAQPIPLDERGRTVVNGTLKDSYDVDFFELGAFNAGDTLVVDVRCPTTDTRAVLFDESQMVIMANDDRNYYAGQKDPRIQVTLRRDHPVLYVGIAGKSQSVNVFTSAPQSDYSLTVTHSSGDGVAPAARRQAVWLEFGGGSGVRIAGEAPENVPAFDVTRISPRFANQQQQIMEQAIAKLMQDYAEFDVEFYRSDRDVPPAGDYTILYFGGYSEVYLGLADNVDWFNSTGRQEAIIYTETLKLFESLRPSSEQIAQAIANVAAHELGHLLGLEHTQGAECVMSEAASAQSVLSVDARLMAAPLNARVFPIGGQDCEVKIAQGVGFADPSMTVDQLVHLRQSSRLVVSDEAAVEDYLDTMDDLNLGDLGLKICTHCEHHEE